MSASGKTETKITVTRLARAVESFRNNRAHTTSTIDVQWKPFQIDPGTAQDGEEMEAYCRRRWGGSGWTHDLRRQGEEDDDPPAPSFANWKWWPHTGRAHQWVLYGIERHDTDSDRLNAVLFRALYEEGANLSLVETLVELGRKVFPNCNTTALRDYLLHSQGHGQVQQEIAEGRRKYKIRSVPYFVIGTLDGSGRPPYGFSGAQPSSTLTEIFRELSTADDDE